MFPHFFRSVSQCFSGMIPEKVLRSGFYRKKIFSVLEEGFAFLIRVSFYSGREICYLTKPKTLATKYLAQFSHPLLVLRNSSCNKSTEEASSHMFRKAVNASDIMLPNFIDTSLTTTLAATSTEAVTTVDAVATTIPTLAASSTEAVTTVDADGTTTLATTTTESITTVDTVATTIPTSAATTTEQITTVDAVITSTITSSTRETTIEPTTVLTNVFAGGK